MIWAYLVEMHIEVSINLWIDTLCKENDYVLSDNSPLKVEGIKRH